VATYKSVHICVCVSSDGLAMAMCLAVVVQSMATAAAMAMASFKNLQVRGISQSALAREYTSKKYTEMYTYI
jgi:hypothetical protein